MKNKKAQVATAALVIIALVLIGWGLFTIVSFKNDFNFRSSEFDDMTNELTFMQNYIEQQAKILGKELASECPACTQTQLQEKAKEFDASQPIRSEEQGNFFIKLRNSDFTFTHDQETNTYSLQIADLFVKSKSNYNELIRNFAICQEFDNNGQFLKNCDSSKSL